MNKIQIYYLSGTGNSLHVAKELHKRIPDSELSPIAGDIHNEALKTTAEAVGFVFPVHYFTVPMVVSDFIKKLDLSTSQYIFAIGTRGGTPCNAFDDMAKILKKKGKKLDASFLINMADNNMRFKSYVAPTPEKLSMLENAAMAKLDSIQSIIMNRESSREEDTDIVHHISPALLKVMSVLTPLLTKKERTVFFCDEKCRGCGTCKQVCLANKINMIDGKPIWQKEITCYACFACINYCPQKAVQIKSMPAMKSYTDIHERYHHPTITARDIAEQKLYQSK